MQLRETWLQLGFSALSLEVKFFTVKSMLNYLQFGKEKVIKSKVQPGDTDTSYSSAPAQLHPTSLPKLSDFTICEITFSHFAEGFGDSKN